MKKALMIVCGILFASHAFAATYSVTQVTDNTYNDSNARLNDRGDVVWAAWVNSADTGWTLFEYNAQTKLTSQISGNTVFYDSHRINNHGDVVWTASDGTDQEVYLYNADTQSVTTLTDNTFEDTNPQISDNGDVTWLQQMGTTASEAQLWRYDAASKTSAVVDFTGATRQGYQSMNAKGDVVWNAVLVDNQQVLLRNAATGALVNVSNNENAINSNQQINDNGDVIWEAWDLATGAQSVMFYSAADQSVRTVATGYTSDLLGRHANAAWVSKSNGSYTISTFDPVSGAIQDIASGTASYGPNLSDISGRGDVIWSVIDGTSWMSQVFNASAHAVVTLTNTTAYGPYELHLGGNGDATWSIWDGADYEVYTYQGDTGVITQLSNNAVNDGVEVINAQGTVVWNRFDATDSEIMMAQRKQEEAKRLDIDVKDLSVNVKEHEAELTLKFVYDGLPAASDAITIGINATGMLNVPFGDFKSIEQDVYLYQDRSAYVMINMAAHTLSAKWKDSPLADPLPTTIAVAVGLGASHASSDFSRR